MRLHTEERLPLARLLQFLELGEQLAHECAKAQADLAPDFGIHRFLKEQARQEAVHAYTFRAAITYIAPRHLGPSPFFEPFARYQRHIQSALSRGDFYETVLAEQVILEGLGEVTLKKLERGLVKRHAPFQRLRRMFLQQEDAHHGFGMRTLERTMEQAHLSKDHLQDRALDYIQIAESMITTGQELLVEMTEDPDWYLTEFHNTLPSWLTYSLPRAVA